MLCYSSRCFLRVGAKSSALILAVLTSVSSDSIKHVTGTLTVRLTLILIIEGNHRTKLVTNCGTIDAYVISRALWVVPGKQSIPLSL